MQFPYLGIILYSI